MIALLLILVPLVGGLVSFFLKGEGQAKTWSFLVSLISLAAITYAISTNNEAARNFHAEWLPMLGASFALKMDGASTLLCLLAALSYPVIFASTWKSTYKSPNSFYGLMLLAQAGIIGVFVAA
ncbi:MAG: NADH-quinone oxidoreductase subunit M, partial [Chitinophagaceae bacterium]|nr:NADH-quinone oxidoreductase subunit M [Chitinophagaceae bacterium]